jgi:hypothetical protein
MTTFNWQVTMLERANDNNKGVTTAHYRCDAVDGEETIGAYGTTAHEPNPEAEGFVAFENLTQDIVLGWVWEQVNKDKVEEQLAEALEVKKNPPTVAELPW